MTKMTEKELLAMTLEDCPLDISFDVALNRIIIGHDDLNKSIALDLDLDDIELIPESPAITFKNLGRFMAKHEEYPEVKVKSGRSSERGLLTAVYVDGKRAMVGDATFNICDITINDERWAKMGVEHE